MEFFYGDGPAEEPRADQSIISCIPNENPEDHFLNYPRAPSRRGSQQASLVEIEVAEMLDGIDGKATPSQKDAASVGSKHPHGPS